MKQSMDALKAMREVRRQAMVWHDAQANVARRELEQMDAQIAAEEGREAKAKEWPQEGDQMWWLDSQGVMFESTFAAGWKSHALAMGMLYRTKADAELVRDFLRSRPRGWLLAMAKLGMHDSVSGSGAGMSMMWGRAKWNALTNDERAALLGQG